MVDPNGVLLLCNEIVYKLETTLSVWHDAMELQMRLFISGDLPEDDPAKRGFKQLCNQPGWDATIKPAAASDMTINPGYKYLNCLQLFGGFGIWNPCGQYRLFLLGEW